MANPKSVRIIEDQIGVDVDVEPSVQTSIGSDFVGSLSIGNFNLRHLTLNLFMVQESRDTAIEDDDQWDRASHKTIMDEYDVGQAATLSCF